MNYTLTLSQLTELRKKERERLIKQEEERQVYGKYLEEQRYLNSYPNSQMIGVPLTYSNIRDGLLEARSDDLETSTAIFQLNIKRYVTDLTANRIADKFKKKYRNANILFNAFNELFPQFQKYMIQHAEARKVQIVVEGWIMAFLKTNGIEGDLITQGGPPLPRGPPPTPTTPQVQATPASSASSQSSPDEFFTPTQPPGKPPYTPIQTRQQTSGLSDLMNKFPTLKADLNELIEANGDVFRKYVTQTDRALTEPITIGTGRYSPTKLRNLKFSKDEYERLSRIHDELKLWIDEEAAISGNGFYRSPRRPIYGKGNPSVYVDDKRLKKNIMAVRYVNNRNYKIKPTPISDNAKDVLEDILNNRYNEKVFNMLSDDEQAHIQLFVDKMNLKNVIQMKNTKDEELIYDFNRLKGEIIAGNNNKKICQELRLLTL